MIIWWAVDTISNDKPGEPWYGFSPESFMATVFEVRIRVVALVIWWAVDTISNDMKIAMVWV